MLWPSDIPWRSGTVDDKALYKLKQNLIEEHLENVEVEKGLVDDPKLPNDSLDAALIINAYHEMSAHEAMLRHIRKALKQNGRLVLMERISNQLESLSREEQTKVHQLGTNFAEHELEEAGFEVLELHDPFLELTDASNGKSRWWLILARKRKPLRNLFNAPLGHYWMANKCRIPLTVTPFPSKICGAVAVSWNC